MPRSKWQAGWGGVVLRAVGVVASAAAPLAAQDPAEVPPLPPPVYDVGATGVAAMADADVRLMTAARVLTIIDGDTFTVRVASPPHGMRTTETVRVRGIDAPELADPGTAGAARAATDHLEVLLAGGEVRLAFDFRRRDRFDRLLAYVYLPDGRSVAAEMIGAGRARHYKDKLGYFFDELQRLEWQAAGLTGVVIDRVCNEGRAEHVVLRNLGGGDAPIDLTGWLLRDAAGNRLPLADGTTLPAGATVTVASGLDSGRPSIWDNDGDEATLLDATGAVVHRYRYP